MESTALISNGHTIPVTTASWTREQIDLIKATVAKGATDNELQLFLYTAKHTGLDPLMKQIHAVKRWNRAENREMLAIQTGIDGYRLIAARTGQHMGTEDAVFDVEDAPHPNKATVTVYRLVHGEKVPFTASARWSEYVQTVKDGAPNSFWARMPYGMLAKCSEGLALRKAFPAELSGVYTHEEMGQADNAPPSRPLVTVPKPVPGVPQETPAPVTLDMQVISPAQQKRLFPLLKEANVSVEDFKAYLGLQHGIEHTKEITRAQYDVICNDITGGGLASWLLEQTTEAEGENEPGSEG